jgi:hypothetical protein
MDKAMKKFYEKYIFDHVDSEKWISYKPRHYSIQRCGKIIAGLSIVKRTLNDVEIDHIWLCGVNEKFQSEGHFRALIDEFKKDCSNIITVATYPEKYNKMYRWILCKGGLLIKRDIDGKCLFVLEKSRI